jgi:hypothetical protein
MHRSPGMGYSSSMNPTHPFWKKLFQFTTWAGLLILLQGLIAIPWTWYWQSQAVRTEGVVVDLISNGEEHRLVCEFSVGSVKHGFVTQPMHERYALGDRVPVLYDPELPASAKLASRWEVWSPPLLAILLGLGMLCFAFVDTGNCSRNGTVSETKHDEHLKLSDTEFLDAFTQCTLPAKLWSHTAHVRLAWLRLAEHPYEDALISVRRGIQSYNEAVLHKENAYHETITVAFMRLVAHAKHAGVDSLSALESTHPALFDRQLSAVLVHYTRDRLMSNEARARFVEPDLVPLPVMG